MRTTTERKARPKLTARRKSNAKPIVRERPPTPPGRILRAYYLAPRGLSIARLARATDLSRKHLSKVVNGGATITPETAMRLAMVLDTTPDLWLNLQQAVDLYDARRRLRHWRPGEVCPPDAAP